MVENWIKVNKYGENCRIDFNNVSVILEEEDVKFLVGELNNWQLGKVLRCIV